MLRTALAEMGMLISQPRLGENRCACPICKKGPRDDALAVLISAERALWICHRCGWAGSTSSLGLTTRMSVARTTRVRLPGEPSNLRSVAANIWNDCVDLRGTLGADYLIARCCAVPSSAGDVRFHPALQCPKVEKKVPALVCRVSTVLENKTVGIHRIFLNPADGKTALAKMRLGRSDEPVCIRLFPDDQVEYGLGIAEGVETSLAAAHFYSPVWATIDAGQMAEFPVLPGIEVLTIYADHDDVGISAALKCVDRWRKAGKHVAAIAPSRPGADINDLVREERHV